LTLLFLGLLAAAWIVVFLPALLRARTEAPLSTAERFKRRLNLLAPRAQTGRWIVVPESQERLRRASFRRGQKRRQQILVALSTAAGISLIAALVAGGAAWEAHLAIDGSLALYVVLLLDAKRRRAERGSNVHALRRRQIPAREDVSFYEPVREASAQHR
jgi:hypothetical protein